MEATGRYRARRHRAHANAHAGRRTASCGAARPRPGLLHGGPARPRPGRGQLGASRTRGLLHGRWQPARQGNPALRRQHRPRCRRPPECPLQGAVRAGTGCHSSGGLSGADLQSVRLARWWQASGFAKGLPGAGHSGKGWVPRVPSAILEANDPVVYGAFLRGLFEADGTVLDGVPSLSTAHESFAAEIRTLLLTMGLAATTRETVSGWGGPIFQIRMRNVDHALNFSELIGFIGWRKDRLVASWSRSSRRRRTTCSCPATSGLSSSQRVIGSVTR